MEQKRILVVDDEQDLCDILLYNLRAAGYEAHAVHSAEEALAMGVEHYHLLLLDVMMPGMSGFQMARRLKQQEATASIPVVFLTAKDAEDDTLEGFSLGADDYVTKPFSVREVVARVGAVLSRTTPASAADGLQFEGLVVDTRSKTVSVDGQPIALTRTEYDLLCLFLSHRGQVYSRQELLREVWPDDVIVTDRTVDVNITRLRKKLGPYASRIATRQGFGYLFCEQ